MSSDKPQVPVNVGDVLLGKYVVERVIGAGGMGVVVAVRHRDLGELYAMKFMLPAALANEQAVDRFVREARAAAKLKSEHVAKVTDVGRLENGSPYMVMEYLTGSDLEGILAQHGTLTPAVAATYVMQACDAIAEAHAAGIVHRDLKPANLFLTKRPNGSPCIKVLDFGISKSITPDENNSMTRTTAIMGSPYYMSPEQMRSSKNVDHGTDIWALGVILYQLTTGRVPFPGETITEVCSGVLADDPPPIVRLLPGIPPEFDAIVRRCLQKQSSQRFGNARELAAALLPVAGHHPGTSGLNLEVAGALPGSPAATAQMSTSSPAVAPGAPMARSGGTVMAEPIAGMAGGPSQTQAGFGKTQPTPRKSGSAVAIVIGALALGGLGAGAFFMMNKGDGGKASAATSQPAETAAKTADATSTTTTTTATAAATATAEKPVETATATAVATATETATATAAETATATATAVAVGPRTKPTAVKTSAPKIPTAPTSTGRSIY